MYSMYKFSGCFQLNIEISLSIGFHAILFYFIYLFANDIAVAATDAKTCLFILFFFSSRNSIKQFTVERHHIHHVSFTNGSAFHAFIENSIWSLGKINKWRMRKRDGELSTSNQMNGPISIVSIYLYFFFSSTNFYVLFVQLNLIFGIYFLFVWVVVVVVFFPVSVHGVYEKQFIKQVIMISDMCIRHVVCDLNKK